MNVKTIATSLGIQYAGRVVGLFVSLASVGLLTRYLGVAQFGEYTAALSIANLVIVFSDFGFFWSTIQNFLNGDNKEESIRDILGIRTVATLVLIVASIIIILAGNFSPVVKQAYLILSIFILSSSINNILIAVYQAEYKMVTPTVVEFLSRVINLGIIVAGILLKAPIVWFIIGISLASFISLAINWIGLYRNHTPVWPRIFGVSWSKYYKSVFLVGLMSLFSALYYKVDVAILSWLKPSVDVGIYGAAQKIIELTMMFQGLFMASLFPLLVSRHNEDIEGFKQITRRSVILMTATGVPISLFGILLAKPVVSLIGGQQFVTEATLSYMGTPITTPIILIILLCFILLSYFGTSFTVGLLASGEVKQLVKVNFLATLLNIGLNLWFLPHYSYLGAALTTLFTEFLILGFNSFYFCRRYSFTPPWGDVAKIIIASFPGIAFLLVTDSWNLIIRMGIVMVIYVAFILLLVPDIRKFIPDLLKRGK